MLTARLPDGHGVRIAIRNHPIGGPTFSGPQVRPWTCRTEENGLGPPADAACNLDVGLIEGAMQVFVNGKRVAPNVTVDRPFADAPNVPAVRRLDVSALLRPGRNELTVVVATTLKNKIVGMARRGRLAGGLAAVQPATQPYGLLGPVKLIPYGRVRL